MSKRKSGVLAVVHARGPTYRDAAAGLLGAVKKITPSVYPHEASQIEMTFPEIHLSERLQWKLSRVY